MVSRCGFSLDAHSHTTDIENHRGVFLQRGKIGTSHFSIGGSVLIHRVLKLGDFIQLSTGFRILQTHSSQVLESLSRVDPYRADLATKSTGRAKEEATLNPLPHPSLESRQGPFPFRPAFHPSQRKSQKHYRQDSQEGSFHTRYS